jgi:DNA modification methylase
MSIANKLEIEYLPVGELKNFDRRLRIPGKKQKQKTMRLLEEVGQITPVVIDSENRIVIGEILAEATKELGIDEIPVVRADHLDDRQIKLLRIAYDRIAEDAGWDRQALAAEFHELEIFMPDIDLSITGFEVGEIDLIIGESQEAEPDDGFLQPDKAAPAVTQASDLWFLGEHRLYCGNSLEKTSYSVLMEDQQAQMVFTDPPYNVPVDGHTGGKGTIKHREFAMASGEMTDRQFTDFLTTASLRLIENSNDGSIHFICMDWRHMAELMAASRQVGYEPKNLCVWAKDNGGMGSLYRSQHELIFVFKNGDATHINNVELGKHGRYRTNVWQYPGVNTLRKERMEELAMHPTVKPVAMVADAILDCSKRGGIILDPFGGSGTTLIAAEKTGRRARLIEIDQHYCDVIIRRWQEVIGRDAVHAASGKTFNELEAGDE